MSWERFEQIQRLIANNLLGRELLGSARSGQALLAGLLRCRRCGHKLTVRYTDNRHDVLRYSCWRGFLDNGEPRCIAFGGIPADEAMGREVLRVVQPAAVEAAILANEEQLQKRDQVVAALQRDLQAAQYAARRAQKQFDATAPENRLVADELERRWNQALLHLLFIFGVIFFLYRLSHVALYVTIFSIGHSVTLLTGVLMQLRLDPYLIDAVIGLSVVYKALDNLRSATPDQTRMSRGVRRSSS